MILRGEQLTIATMSFEMMNQLKRYLPPTKAVMSPTTTPKRPRRREMGLVRALGCFEGQLSVVGTIQASLTDWTELQH